MMPACRTYRCLLSQKLGIGNRPRTFFRHKRFFAATIPESSTCASSSQTLIVVRHGETEWNKALRIQGITDVPLNDKGQLQAQASAQALLEELRDRRQPSVIYSSDKCRASATAQAIAESLNASRTAEDKITVSVSQHSALSEWNLGVLEGLRKEEAMAQHENDWNIFSEWADPLVSVEHAKTVISKGESMEDVRLRVT